METIKEIKETDFYICFVCKRKSSNKKEIEKCELQCIKEDNCDHIFTYNPIRNSKDQYYNSYMYIDRVCKKCNMITSISRFNSLRGYNQDQLAKTFDLKVQEEESQYMPHDKATELFNQRRYNERMYGL